METNEDLMSPMKLSPRDDSVFDSVFDTMLRVDPVFDSVLRVDSVDSVSIVLIFFRTVSTVDVSFCITSFSKGLISSTLIHSSESEQSASVCNTRPLSGKGSFSKREVTVVTATENQGGWSLQSEVSMEVIPDLRDEQQSFDILIFNNDLQRAWQ